MDPTRFFEDCNAILSGSGVTKATAFDDDFAMDAFESVQDSAQEFIDDEFVGDVTADINDGIVLNGSRESHDDALETVAIAGFSRMLNGIVIPEISYEVNTFADFVRHTITPGDPSKLCDIWNDLYNKSVTTEEEIFHEFALIHYGVAFEDFAIGELPLDLVERVSPAPCVITKDLLAEVTALPSDIDCWQYLTLHAGQDSGKLIEFMQSQAYKFEVALDYAKQGMAAMSLFIEEVLQNDGMIFTISEKELLHSATASGITIERAHLKKWKELSILESVLKYRLAGGDAATVLRLEEAPKWLIRYYQTHTLSGGLLDAVVQEGCNKYYCELPAEYNTDQLFPLVNAYYSGKLDECTYQQYLFSLQFENAKLYDFSNCIPPFNKYWMDCICRQTGLRVQSLDNIGDTIVILDEKVRCISLYEFLAGAVQENLAEYNAKFLNDNKGIILFKGAESLTVKYGKMYLWGQSTMVSSAMAITLECSPLHYNAFKLRAYLERTYPDFDVDRTNYLFTTDNLQAMRNDKVLRYAVHYAPEIMDVFVGLWSEDVITAMKPFVHLGNKTVFKLKFLERLFGKGTNWDIPVDSYHRINLDTIVIHNRDKTEISWKAFCCALSGLLEELPFIRVWSEDEKLCIEM